MRPDDPALLIASASGRALAASARRGGYVPYVIDYFEDFDTRQIAQRSKNACLLQAFEFDAVRLLAGAKDFSQKQHFTGVVIGSGFEADTALLEKLAKGHTLFGNTPDVIRRVKHPQEFFSLLDQLGMPHPPTQMHKPNRSEGWLVKTIGGAGGGHVHPAARAAENQHTYFQHHEAGRNLSALFLADGKRAHMIGFNEQWVAPLADAPYCYGGAVNHVTLPQSVQQDIARKLDQMVAAIGLVGLNGLDFILRGADYFALELNPRPPATFELYDNDYAEGLLHWHLQACAGRFPPAQTMPTIIRGHGIPFAGHAINIPLEFKFPDWCRDIPHPGSVIPCNAPLCTVHAEGADHEQVKTLLKQRQQHIQSSLQEQSP